MSDNWQKTWLDEYDEKELVFHEDGRITRKRFLIAGGGAALGAAAGPLIFSGIAQAAPRMDATKLPYKANLNVKADLTFWHFWASPLRRGAIHQAISQFQSIYKHVKINDSPSLTGAVYDKLYAAVAAQSGVPDVNISNRLTLWNDIPAHKLYIDLSPYNAKDKIPGSAFFKRTWDQCNVKVKGKNGLYSLPFETDIRVLFINRAKLVDAGLNPNTKPTTWSQLKTLADKLDVKGGSGYNRITYWPVDFGLASLVWDNNSDWVNKKNVPIVNSAKNVATAEFERFWIDRYGGRSGYNALNAQSNAGVDMFASQLQVFHVDQPTYQDFTLIQHGIQFHPASQAKSNMFPYWDVGLLPVAGKGIHPWSFSGGFSVGAPRNNHRSSAQTAAAWEFIKFMAMIGQVTFERFAGNIPCVQHAVTHDSFFTSKPNWSTFVAALKYQHSLVQNKYDPLFPGDVITKAENAMLDQSKTPQQALNDEQAEALSIMKRTGGP